MSVERTSPAYASHLEHAAVFREKAGWLRVDYFRSNEAAGDVTARPENLLIESWSPAIEAEHRAVRETVGLFDLTSFSKIEVEGPGAFALVERVYSNIVGRGTGSLTYTQMLNPDGGVIGDVTVAQTADDAFRIIAGTAALAHDIGWLREQAANDPTVFICDVTSQYACFGVWGHQARDVVQPLVDIPLDSISFPYMSTRTGYLDDVPIRMCRVTYVGELGWEIYVPSEYGRNVWAVLSQAVLAAGGRHCGYKAIDSLRCEKGYLYLGSELTADRSPKASGVGMFVRMNKEFIGRDAVAYLDDDSALRCLTLDDKWIQLAGGEDVLIDGNRVGKVTSGGVAFTLRKAVGFAFLPESTVFGDSVQVVINGTEVPATVVSQPLYDPTGARLRV